MPSSFGALTRSGITATNDEVKRRFAERLRAALKRKGWSQARTVEQARRFLDAGERLGPAHLSHYLNARAIPQMSYLRALAQALEVSEQELLSGIPGGMTITVDDLPPAELHAATEVRDAENGEAWLKLNERVPWETAIEILRLVKAANNRRS